MKVISELTAVLFLTRSILAAPLAPSGGRYIFTLPANSAALITL